jgi:o-succinylbenzoate synthase
MTTTPGDHNQPVGEAPITACRQVPYSLDLRAPWVDARGRTTARQGWIVEIRAGGLRGFGDCAPLVSAGTEAPEHAQAALGAVLPRMEGVGPAEALARLPGPPGPAPAARCAIETALLDLLSQAAGKPLCAFLAGEAAFREQVEVNGVLGSVETALARLPEVIAAGYRVAKLKLGTGAWTSERPALMALVAALPPGMRLRLDVNGAWSPEEATAIIPQLNRWPVESVEEPAGGATRAELVRLQRLASFPLALDESLAGRSLADPPVGRQVLKPMVVGGPAALVRRADSDIESVVTTTIDSAVGAWAAAHAAAAVAGRCGSGQCPAHGLATSDWLAEDLAEGPVPQRGRLMLPGVPGLGVVPDLRCGSRVSG